AMERTSLDYQTLRNYAWVAGKVARSRRRPELSFQHHQEVAALPPDEQDYWLGRAVEGSWSRAELRRRLRLGTDGGVPTPPRLRIRLDVDLSRWVFWQQAAESLESDVVTWLVSAADRAAGL
ncbi:LmbU family transcriptional regulator, partial [Streptomyces umbrinus]